ncbi:MAG: aldehyde dehydrogenase family protein, partial [Erythrobacter sp.]|nr:aldehyde dehydrogenase family protein [Erythrobacter sp.]
MTTTYANLIGGEMVTTDATLDVVNPATEQVIAQVPACGKDELDRAVDAARAAFKSWRKTTPEERQKVVLGIAAAIKDNADELFRLLTSEQGKPHAQAQQEIYGAAGLAKAQAGLTLDDVINQDDDTRLSR